MIKIINCALILVSIAVLVVVLVKVNKKYENYFVPCTKDGSVICIDGDLADGYQDEKTCVKDCVNNPSCPYPTNTSCSDLACTPKCDSTNCGMDNSCGGTCNQC